MPDLCGSAPPWSTDLRKARRWNEQTWGGGSGGRTVEIVDYRKERGYALTTPGDVPSDPDESFAGDLFLALAVDGRLVLEKEQADHLIAGLERTLELVKARVRVLELWRGLSTAGSKTSCPAERHVVDAVFADQIAPGRMEDALRELPKYIQAFRAARRHP